VNVYALFDRKLKEYQQLFYGRNDNAVMRGIADGVKSQPGTLMHSHPEDFDMVQVGEFDPETGELARVSLRLVVNLGSLLIEAQRDPEKVRLREVG